MFATILSFAIFSASASASPGALIPVVDQEGPEQVGVCASLEDVANYHQRRLDAEEMFIQTVRDQVEASGDEFERINALSQEVRDLHRQARQILRSLPEEVEASEFPEFQEIVAMIDVRQDEISRLESVTTILPQELIAAEDRFAEAIGDYESARDALRGCRN